MYVIKVSEISETAFAGVYDCNVSFRREMFGSVITVPFTYNRGDDSPLTLAITKWLEKRKVKIKDVAKKYVSPLPTKNDINAEAKRRIRAIYPEYKQMNVLMSGTDEEKQGMREFIEHIRKKSNLLVEKPVPDYTDDKHWS